VNSVVRSGCGAVALSLLAATVAGAQDRPEPRRNPFADLFGRAPDKTAKEYTRLDFNTLSGVQSAQTLDGDLREANGIQDGISGSAAAMLALEHIRDRFRARAHGRGSYQEFRQERPFGAAAYDGGAQLTVQPATRLVFDASARVTRSPFFHTLQLSPFDLSRPALPADSFAIRLLNNTSYEGAAGVVSNYTRRSSVTASVHRRETLFDESRQNNFSSSGAEIQWKRRMSRDLSVHAGFGRDEVRQRRDDASPFVNERIDIGVDYSRSVAVGPRTALSFSTDTSVVRENDGPKHYRVNGAIDLDKRFNQSWQAMIGARRSTDFLPGFGQPVLSDRGHASLAGYLTRRLSLNVNAAAGRGQLGFGDARAFHMYSGDARLTVAVSRHIGIFTQYVYYHYQLPPDASSVVLVPRLSRQALSIGFQTWLPIIDKDKVSRDPR
jgi:hypothetical protein